MSEQYIRKDNDLHPMVTWRIRRIIYLAFKGRKEGVDYSNEIAQLYASIDLLQFYIAEEEINYGTSIY